MTETKSETSNEQTTERCACMDARQAARRLMKMFETPAGAKQHFRQARIEMLKGVRELLDHRIQQLSQEPHKGTRITVE
jgi:hypothetical protein